MNIKPLLRTLALVCFLLSGGTATAQRHTDSLDRGLVAMKSGSGVFLSWRILAEEYYNVTYNVYRDGQQLNSEPLSVSNYKDNAGTTASASPTKFLSASEASWMLLMLPMLFMT